MLQEPSHFLTIVTWNIGKYEQIAAVLSDVIMCRQEAIDLFEPQTNDMLAVSRTKAGEAFTTIGWPVLVDDSGIYFSAYKDFPGVFSKYIFQSLGVEGVRRVVAWITQDAYYQCVLSYMDATLSEPKQFVGRVNGILDFSFVDSGEVTINHNLPFDTIFRADGMTVVAQLDMSTFTTLHHRAQAATLCKEWLIHTGE